MKYPYVDIQYGDKNSQWKRILIDEIPKYEAESSGVDFRVSVLRFRSPFPQDNESCISPLFIDVDVKGKPEKALEDTRKVIKYLREELQITEPYPRIWFSGQKGFHIIVSEDIFKIAPHTHLQDILSNAVDHISNVVGVKTIDKSIYSKRRVIRYENTQHPVTKLYKTEFSYEEIMRLSMLEIIEKSKKKRTFIPSVPFEQFIPSTPAENWWKAIVLDWNNRQKQEDLRPKGKLKILNTYPQCIQHFLDNKPPDGLRNRVVYTLASYFYNQGMPQAEVEKVLDDWTRKHYSFENHKLLERLANAKNVVRTVFEKDYLFSCNICRTIDPNSYYCPGFDRCQHIDSPDTQEPEKAPLVELSSATDIEWKNKTMRIPVQVVGVSSAYAIPKVIRAVCANPPSECDGECTICTLYSAPNNEITKIITMKTRECLRFFNVSDEEQASSIKKMIGISRKCRYATMEYLQYTSISEVRLTPLLRSIRHRYYEKDVDPVTEKMEFAKQKYTHKTGYFLGNLSDSNEKYMITCTCVTHPATQQLVFLIEDMESITTDVDSFAPSREQLEMLKVFQQRPGQSVEEKFDEIHSDFEANIHRIVKRKILGYAVDLSYHSVISFNLGHEFVHKGWMEVVIFGDSAEGKTQVVQSLYNHYQLGSWINGEAERRTGLGYIILNVSTKTGNDYIVQWGALPRNDRGLLVIDEFAGVDEQAFKELTAARADGVIQGTGKTNNQEAYCRTRTIYMSNPKPRKDIKGANGTMSEYSYGIEAFHALYPEHQDARRVDFAVAVKRNELSIFEVNAPYTKRVPHIYTSELCKMLVLWAWTRRKEHIIFEEDALNEVYSAAIRMCGKYAISPKSWLVEKSTQKHKIARAAVAIACRLFSTDETMSRVIVKREHVLFAEKLFYMSYDSKAMQYDVFAENTKSITHIDESLKRDIEHKIDRSLRPRCTLKNLLKNVCNTSIITHDRLLKWGVDSSKVSEIMDELRENGLIDAEDVKTEIGIDVFKSLYERYKRDI